MPWELRAGLLETPRDEQGQDVPFQGCLDHARFHMGLCGNGLLAPIDANEEGAFFTPKREVTSFQTWEMQLDALMLVFKFTHHASMDFMVKHGTDGMWPNGLWQRIWLTVKQTAHFSQRLKTNDFSIG